MKPIICLLYISYLFLWGQYEDHMGATTVKIKLNKLSEIEQLVQLSLKADGYILDNKYWLTAVSLKELAILKSSAFVFAEVALDTNTSLEYHTSYLSNEIKSTFGPCGYQLNLAYKSSKKLSFLSIQVIDLTGKQYVKKLGYNIPPGDYESKISSHNWPDNIYLIQLANPKEVIIQKVIQKYTSTKKI